jgi:hypothetical protein
MEISKVELRNKKFLKNDFKSLQTDPSIKRKQKRSEAFTTHRQLESILNLDPSNKSSLESLENFEVSGLNITRQSILLQKLSDLLHYPHLVQSVLHLLMNLTSTSNYACEFLFNSEIFPHLVTLIESKEVVLIEDGLICIGNAILGQDFKILNISRYNLVFSISSFLSGDFEKSEEALKTSLWCIWCLVHKRLIEQKDLEIIESLVLELLEYEELRTDLLKICLSFSTFNPEFLKKIAFQLCFTQFNQKDHKIYFLLVIKNVLEFVEFMDSVMKALLNLLEDDLEVKITTYKVLSLLGSRVIEGGFFRKALQDCCSFKRYLGNAASKALKIIISCFQQAQVIQVFDGETLILLAQALKDSNDETAENLMNVCRFLMEAGISQRFFEAGCVEALSVIYYRRNKELSKLAEDLLKNYLTEM